MKKTAFFLCTRTYLVAVLAFSINMSSCENDKHEFEKQRGSITRTEKQEPDLKDGELFPFQKIRSNSQLRRRFIDFELLPKHLKPIPKSFFKKWLKNTYVDLLEKKIKYRLPTEVNYQFYDFAETDELFLFSIISSNTNSSQKELIHFTCDKTTGKINHAEWIAKNESAGGYSNHSKIAYSADRLTLISTSEITEPSNHHWETHTSRTKYIFQAERTIEQNLE